MQSIPGVSGPDPEPSGHVPGPPGHPNNKLFLVWEEGSCGPKAHTTAGVGSG